MDVAAALDPPLVSKVFEDLGKIKNEDASNSLRTHRIRNHHAGLNKVIVMIKETINPFDVNLDPDKLYNIGNFTILVQD